MRLFSLSILALTLAACAPGATQPQAPTATDQATYRTTCAAALAGVARVAPTLRPPSNSVDRWSPYEVTRRDENIVTLFSNSVVSGGTLGVLTSLPNVASSVWTCAQSGDLATLTVASTGLPEGSLRGVHAAFFDALHLPRP